MQKFKWIIEIEIDKTWIADGYDPDESDIEAMLLARLPNAYDHEVKAKIIKRPFAIDIAKAQGYKTVKDYLESKKQ